MYMFPWLCIDCTETDFIFTIYQHFFSIYRSNFSFVCWFYKLLFYRSIIISYFLLLTFYTCLFYENSVQGYIATRDGRGIIMVMKNWNVEVWGAHRRTREVCGEIALHNLSSWNDSNPTNGRIVNSKDSHHYENRKR